MALPETADIVRSLAGHDKGQLFLVVSAEDGYVYLADGKRRKAARPKRKSAKHTALVARGDPPLRSRIAGGAVTDRMLREILALYAAAQEDMTEGGDRFGKR